MAMKCNTAAEIWKYFQQKEDLEDKVLAMVYTRISGLICPGMAEMLKPS